MILTSRKKLGIGGGQSLEMRTLVILGVFGVLGLVSGDDGRIDDGSFDFIVVGGGPAGCAVASRLSESRGVSVLLLEAGRIPNPTLDIPALSPNASFTPEGDYVKIFSSVPQANAGRDTDGVVSYWGGEVLGGGSSVNMMVFNRGSPYDYDNWARLTGDRSWNYDNLLYYFKRIEDYLGEYPSDQHGYYGPIAVSKPRYSPGEQFWLEAGRHLGYQSDIDQNGPQQISFTTVEKAKRFGRRVSAYTGYIKHALRDSNRLLKVMVEAFVSRIVFDGNRATGVIYRSKNGAEHFVRANKEVILTAGVLSTPTILMRSGVGPRAVLRRNGIQPVAILPVGRNFHDHVVVSLNFVVGNNSLLMMTDRDLNPQTWEEFLTRGDGPYTNFGANAQFFIRSPRNKVQRKAEREDDDRWPNLQALLVFGGLGNFFYPFPSEDIKMARDEGAAIITPFVTRPRSRGTVTLNTTDIEGDPVIDFQLLTDPEDAEDLLHAIKVSLDVIEKTPSFARIGARYPPNPLPSCRHLKFRSDSYWRCFIRQTAGPGHHGAGTCKMGGPGDPEAVVDTSLRVIGIENVRVADTSIMPAVVNANTMVGAYVIGEKAADMILDTHSRR